MNTCARSGVSVNLYEGDYEMTAKKTDTKKRAPRKRNPPKAYSITAKGDVKFNLSAEVMESSAPIAAKVEQLRRLVAKL